MSSASSANCGVALTAAVIAASSVTSSAAYLLQKPRLHPLHDVRYRMLAPILQIGLQVEQSLARIDDLRQPLAFGVIGLVGRLGEGLGKPGDHLRIDDIVLGKPSG